MKKIYSMIAMSLLATGTVAGEVVTYDASLPLARKSFRDRTAVARGMSTRASSTSSSLPENGWGYNCGIYNWNGYQNQVSDFKMATGFTGDVLESISGKTLSEVAIVAPALTNSKVQSMEMTLFVTNDLDGTPIVEVPYTTTGCPFDEDGYIIDQYDVIELPEPIVIDGSKPLYVGVKSPEVAKNNYPIPFDGVPFDGEGLLTSTGGKAWENETEYLGSLCLYLGLDEMPVDMARILSGSFQKQANVGDELSGDFEVYNIGGNDLSSAAFTMQLGTEPSVNIVCTPDNGHLLGFNYTTYEYEPGIILSRDYGVAEITGFPVTVSGVLPLSCSLSEINGKANAWGNAPQEQSLLVLPEGTGYPRTVVVEEGTGLWCGFCVRGYVGMEYMAAKYTDGSYIGIAAHSDDPMESPTYAEVVERYFDGFPSAMVNRMDEEDPSAEDLEAAYLKSVAMPSYGKIDMAIKGISDSDMLSLVTTSEVVIPGNYAVAFALKEDGVGPYKQHNYYAGGAYGEMGGFENEGEMVELMFNEVARSIYNPFGIGGSLPDNMETGVPYEFEYDIPLAYSTDDTAQYKVVDREKSYVVAMLLDTNTGYIVNAAQLPLAGVKVNDVEQASSAKVIAGKGLITFTGEEGATVYTADGRMAGRIAANGQLSVAPGIYMVNAGSDTFKVVVR